MKALYVQQRVLKQSYDFYSLKIQMVLLVCSKKKGGERGCRESW